MRLQICLILGLALAAGAPGQAPRAEITIGFANPLSGPFSQSGERNRIAVEMAIEDLNARGGVLGQKVTLVVADDACGMRRAVAAARLWSMPASASWSGTCAPIPRCSRPASTRPRTSR